MIKRLQLIIIALLFFSALTTYSGPGDGIHLGEGFILTPRIEGSVTYDDNIWRAPEDMTIPGDRGVESDLFYALKLQLSINRHSGSFRNRLDGWGRIQRYQDRPIRDTDELGIRLETVTGSRTNLLVSLVGRYVTTDHYDTGPTTHDLGVEISEVEPLSDPTLKDRYSLAKRELYEGSIGLGRDLTEKTMLDLRFRLISVDYDDVEPFPELLLKMNDRTTYNLMGELGFRVTEKTAVFITGDGELQDSEAYDSDALRLGLRIGASQTTTEKLRFRTAVGYNRYEYESFPLDPRRGEPGAFSPDRGPAVDESHESFAADLGAWWHPTQRLIVRATVNTGYRPAVQYDGNATFDMAGQLNAGYLLGRSHQLNLSAGLRREDYLQRVRRSRPDPLVEDDCWIDKYVDLATIALFYVYQPENFPLEWRIGARRNIAKSNDLEAEYDVMLWNTGLALWY